jgi:hypothetical protein
MKFKDILTSNNKYGILWVKNRQVIHLMKDLLKIIIR